MKNKQTQIAKRKQIKIAKRTRAANKSKKLATICQTDTNKNRLIHVTPTDKSKLYSDAPSTEAQDSLLYIKALIDQTRAAAIQLAIIKNDTRTQQIFTDATDADIFELLYDNS